ncbi:hypothetical protein HPB49_023198 [Dermacentor silvarum]|uniref:Uncharacterized protein n=1 Tax=Dermacentor silvarum TaxID=543639 RepID=A0ACB8E3E5_DERSI|nr:hypothetical protein HPB49_023198 [Dermacentor silvarum]
MASSNENVVDLSGSVIERFLDAVQQHPCVYDTKRMDYRDVDRKNNAWELIRLFAGLSTVEECLKLWKRLRDRYTRELKTIEQTKRSGSGYVSRRAWEFAESMAFYRDCGRPRNQTFSRDMLLKFLNLDCLQIDEPELSLTRHRYFDVSYDLVGYRQLVTDALNFVNERNDSATLAAEIVDLEQQLAEVRVAFPS